MQDLLNEHDFIKPEYNPWPLFRRFYLFAVVQVIVTQAIISFMLKGVTSLLLILIYLLLPLITVVWMFTANTKNFLLDRKTKVLAIFLLLLCFIIPDFLINTVKIIYKPKGFFNLYLLQFLTTLFFSCFQSLSCLGVMFLISKIIKSKLKQV